MAELAAVALGTNVRPVAGSVATESATLLQPSGPLGVRTSECSTRAGGRRVAAGVDDADERRLQPDAGLSARLLCGEIVLMHIEICNRLGPRPEVNLDDAGVQHVHHERKVGDPFFPWDVSHERKQSRLAAKRRAEDVARLIAIGKRVDFRNFRGVRGSIRALHDIDLTALRCRRFRGRSHKGSSSSGRTNTSLPTTFPRSIRTTTTETSSARRT